jgi:hypothetical protein
MAYHKNTVTIIQPFASRGHTIMELVHHNTIKHDFDCAFLTFARLFEFYSRLPRRDTSVTKFAFYFPDASFRFRPWALAHSVIESFR